MFYSSNAEVTIHACRDVNYFVVVFRSFCLSPVEVKKEVGRNDTMNLEVDDSDGEDGVSDSSSSMPQPVAVVRRQHNESTPVTHHTKRKRVDVTTPSSSSRQQPVYQQQQQAQSEPRDDPDMLFFKSLLPYMRSMDMATYFFDVGVDTDSFPTFLSSGKVRPTVFMIDLSSKRHLLQKQTRNQT